ncbi:transmembrane protein [Paramagnetospirillum caucaseum]|uniref:Transmembrane protein n=1 Tax=Paramagnetospirillum caucaseum TaxID=1244869 RepID=M2Y914_9PROT|nr:hypothetical protein [Paramagnetospirillum caucaseum]EME69531.1 transmembrane protein [Paramagnetospirillum caucaseum]
MAGLLTPSTRRSRIVLGAGLLGLLALPPLREAMESDMARHMLVQIPLLALCGWLCAPSPATGRNLAGAWDRHGIVGILTANLVAAYWMLPRTLDNTIASAAFEAAKFISLPLLVGVPLRRCWSRLPMLGQGFVVANAVSMLGIVGWLYLAAPVRVCVYYLVDQQEVVGRALLYLAGAITLAVLVRAFVGTAQSSVPFHHMASPQRHPHFDHQGRGSRQ